ncbi:hypothetical protein niasHS_006621 [Heterodera schachtii]|uniref:AB hydrolase-1 domain-containing protein n=1 Tax=Heterodera schachtii TaxID=97005 RepID=A0ABD2JHS2_HETSC
MSNLLHVLFGPVVYRPYQPNLLESGGNKLFSIGAGAYNTCVVLSPILVPYIAFSWTHSHHFSFLRFVLVFYAIAFSFRTIGRLTNVEYVRFIKLLGTVRKSPQNVTLLDTLKNYDFQVNGPPVVALFLIPFLFSVFAAPVDFKASPGRTSKWHPPRERFPDLASPLNFLRQAIAWTSANTFGRRMLFPGSMALFNSMLNSQLVDGRRKLLTEMGGKRKVIETEDGGKVDSVFIDKRGKGEHGNILIICCEGNAGYYEMGIMSTPVNLGYSALGWNLPGFAESTGTPLPHTILNSMEAVMQFAVNHLGFQPQQIVLFGWSIGGFAATWAAANYPQIKALILDASFDDVVPLASARMPAVLEGLVRFAVRTHLDLPVAKQLQRYEGPVLLIRRWNDEIIATDTFAKDDATRRASNRINHLLVSLLHSRHPGLLKTKADEKCVFEWLFHEPQERLFVYPPEDSLEPQTLNDSEMKNEQSRHRFIRQLCTKYFFDFMDATHNVALDPQHFKIPTAL